MVHSSVTTTRLLVAERQASLLRSSRDARWARAARLARRRATGPVPTADGPVDGPTPALAPTPLRTRDEEPSRRVAAGPTGRRPAA